MKSADKGLAPIFTGHEPIMLLLHQSAYNYILASEGFEPSHIMMKTLCLKPLDYKALIKKNIQKSPVQVSHLFQLVTKQLHYFYANQANINNNFM